MSEQGTGEAAMRPMETPAIGTAAATAASLLLTTNSVDSRAMLETREDGKL